MEVECSQKFLRMTINEIEQFGTDVLLMELRTRAEGIQPQAPLCAATARSFSSTIAAQSATTKLPELLEATSQQIIEVIRAQQKAIYDVDNRMEIFNVSDPGVLRAADSVVALFNSSDLNANGDGTFSLVVQPYGSSFNPPLCSGERFRTQPVGSFCSGFLVAPDLIATAGHCVNSQNVRDRRCVFGFRMLDDERAQTTVPRANVYRGLELAGHVLSADGTDWALIRLDRPVEDRPIARIRRSGMVTEAQAVYVIGHPVGLPLKFADGAQVRDNSPRSFFSANLDTYGGNSGSPVFSIVDGEHLVEGILVRGATDFVQAEGCTRSLVIPTTGVNGEDCTRTTEFAHLVPEA